MKNKISALITWLFLGMILFKPRNPKPPKERSYENPSY